MRERNYFIQSISAYTKDNVPVNVAGTLFFKISDANKACFEVEDYENSVFSIGKSTVRAVIGRFEYDRITAERNAINDELKKDIDKGIENWGINCTRFEIQSFCPQSEQVARQLELQMEAERRRRENELVIRAKINTSDGERQSAILSFQGILESSKNQAKTNFALAQKQAESKFSKAKLNKLVALIPT